MASTYFLNGQPDKISIQLNNGMEEVLAGFESTKLPPAPQPFYVFGLAASAKKDVLGTSEVNTLKVNTTTSGQQRWKITLSGVLPDKDIQFLVFANKVIGRQGMHARSFEITPDNG